MRAIRVVWLTGNLPQGRISGADSSAMASVRYRILLLADYLNSHGVETVAFHPEGWEAMIKNPPDVLVVPKLGAPTVDETLRWQESARQAVVWLQERGTRIIADYCDVHFDTPVLGQFQSWLARCANQVVTSTPLLAELVRQRFNLSPHLISDPYEYPRGPVDFALPKPRSSWDSLRGRPREPFHLLWYGHPSNFSDLLAWLHDFESDGWGVEVKLEVVTSPLSTIADALESYQNGKQLSVALTPWSTDAVRQGLKRCHCVVIPSQVDQGAKGVKSPNRLVEAVWAGRFVAANPLPSYLPFADWVWLGDELELGLQWLLQHQDEARTSVIKAQAYVTAHHAPDVIAEQWLQVFKNNS